MSISWGEIRVDPIITRRLQQSFLEVAQQARGTSPLMEALCQGLSREPSPAAAEIFDRYRRIVSADVLDVPLMLTGLHWIALKGEAPEVAKFYPSCGGSFSPQDAPSLVAAAEEALWSCREEVLDFMLSRELRQSDVQWSTGVLLGALKVVQHFGGGLSLVEMGTVNGLNLLFDQYAYRLGNLTLGDSPLLLAADLQGEVPAEPVAMPEVRGRWGLDPSPQDLSNPEDRLAAEAAFWPDQVEMLTRFRAAVNLMAETGSPTIWQGNPDDSLKPLLQKAYSQMEPGNTLLLFNCFTWNLLSDEQQNQAAMAVQQLASQIQPHKPVAWLQIEPVAPGSTTVELRLNTFGWVSREDRVVSRLAEADLPLQTITWKESQPWFEDKD